MYAVKVWCLCLSDSKVDRFIAAPQPFGSDQMNISNEEDIIYTAISMIFMYILIYTPYISDVWASGH